MDRDRYTRLELEREADRLRASRPVPSADFVEQLELNLLPAHRRAHGHQRPRVVLAAGASALSLAGLALVFGLAGSGPLRIGAGDAPKAHEECPLVMVRGRERLPVIVTGPDGAAAVRYRSRHVRRPVRRCR